MSATHFSLYCDKAKNQNQKIKMECKKMEDDFMLDHIWRYQREKLEVGRKLPPSHHKLPGQDFDLKKSEVTKWLIDQPDILSFVFEIMKKSEAIVYDKETKKWQGIDWEDEDDE